MERLRHPFARSDAAFALIPARVVSEQNLRCAMPANRT